MFSQGFVSFLDLIFSFHNETKPWGKFHRALIGKLFEFFKLAIFLNACRYWSKSFEALKSRSLSLFSLLVMRRWIRIHDEYYLLLMCAILDKSFLFLSYLENFVEPSSKLCWAWAKMIDFRAGKHRTLRQKVITKPKEIKQTLLHLISWASFPNFFYKA